MRWARIVGHASWWVFVVAGIFGVLAPGYGSEPRRYADYVGGGWTAYTPLTSADVFAATNALVTIALIAAVITVVAACTEAVLARRWPLGVVTIATPIAGAAIIGFALSRFIDTRNPTMSAVITLLLIMLGVAIREVWSRRARQPV